MKHQLLMLALAIIILVIALILATTGSRDEFYRFQTIDQSQYRLQGIDQNPWKQFAATFNIMQLPKDCQNIMDLYSAQPTEENFAKLLNCNTSPEEASKIKTIAATFAGPK